MPKPVKRLQPLSYHAFRCIGAVCEDSCCIGWTVYVDKLTYAGYQQCNDPELGPQLRELVTISTATTHDDDHARITVSRAACPFLSEGLCAIQKKLGAHQLSIMCATYPRVMNVVDDVLQRSLNLSCPEAARLVLLDPNPMEFDEHEGGAHDPRFRQLPVLSTSKENSGKPFRYFHEIRGLVIGLLQNRAFPLCERLVMLGSLCDELHETAAAVGGYSKTLEDVERYREAADRDLFREALNNYHPQPVAQLELFLGLILERIGSGFTAPRFLNCYREFVQGMHWTEETSMNDLGQRLRSVFTQHYEPFMNEHEYMLEHYLVNYVHRTLFPLGPQESYGELSAHHSVNSIRDHCLLMIAHYGVIQTILIGMAGFHQAEFGVSHVVTLIQSFAKTFEHSSSFPDRTVHTLAEHRIKTCASLAILVRN